MRYAGTRYHHHRSYHLAVRCLTALCALTIPLARSAPAITIPSFTTVPTISSSSTVSSSGETMPNISTHILDTSRGKPAPEVPVTLFRQHPNGQSWTKIGTGITDTDGRFRNFFVEGQSQLATGTYKLHFQVEPYFRGRNVESFYPFVDVVFTVANPEQHYHIPLLLNPFGYSTYRGS